MKERNILATSLPPTILVRAFDDRLDLLRCLIVGPVDTPFANAPFLFDIQLPPGSFPSHPPKVFFYSWSDNKPISPNLYTDGTVCLSLLGTWDGEGSEQWVPDKSTVLQVLVSVQALIMVEQPYFTEPGFEECKGARRAEQLSDAYSETTFLLTRDFIRNACDRPSRTFAAELAASYLDGTSATGPAALKGVIEQARALVAESEACPDRGEVVQAEGPEDYFEEMEAYMYAPPRPGSGSEGSDRPRSGVAAGLAVVSEAGCGRLREAVAGLEAVARARGKEWWGGEVDGEA